jgi:excisionase family DNA binding protein
MADAGGAWLSMRQVAARLNIPVSRAYELARQGRLKAVKIGKYVRLSPPGARRVSSCLATRVTGKETGGIIRNEQGGVDMATIWKRKDRDTWVVDYRDSSGKRIRLTAATRQEAEHLLADKIKEGQEARPLAGELYHVTLSDYVARWSDRVKGEIEEKTWLSSWQNLTHHVLPALGHLKVREITVSHVAGTWTSAPTLCASNGP